jgi:hypothetical protein
LKRPNPFQADIDRSVGKRPSEKEHRS